MSEGPGGVTRRDVLKGTGALLAVTAALAVRPGILVAGDDDRDDAFETLVDLEPVARLPSEMRPALQTTARLDPPRLLELPRRLGVLRARDLLMMRVRLAGLRRVCLPDAFGATGRAGDPGRHLALVPEKDADAHLVYELPPQHVAEASWYDGSTRFPSALNGPVRAWLSGSSRLAFTVPKGLGRPEHGVLWSTTGLLEWERLEPRLVRHAVPASPVPAPDGSVEPAPPVEAGRPEPPAEDRTAIEVPARLVLSPNRWVGWRHAAVRAATAKPPVPLELWHTLAGAPRSYDAAHVGTERDDLRAVRAIWHRAYQGGPCADPVRWFLPSEGDREQIVHLSSDFSLPGITECGVPSAPRDRYVPLDIPFQRLALSSRGATVQVHGTWDPSTVGGAGSSFSVQEWKQDTVWGRDQFVKVVHKGYLWPFGHEASVVAVARRVVKHLEVNGRTTPVGFLVRETWVEVRQPTVEFPEIPDGVNDVGRACPFSKVRLRTLKTPALRRGESVLVVRKEPLNEPAPECIPPRNVANADDREDEANWRAFAMVPIGSDEPFPFEVEAEDRQGARVTFRMPMIWIHRRAAERRFDEQGTLKGYEAFPEILAKIAAREKERVADLGGASMALVPARGRGRGAAGGEASPDDSIQVLRMVFAAETPEQQPGSLPAPPPDGRHWGHPVLPSATASRRLRAAEEALRGVRPLPTARRCLTWSPALLAAEVRLPDAAVMAPGGAAPVAWMTWHAQYLGAGFEPGPGTGNPGEVYARALPQTEAAGMTCDPERGGGLITPSGGLLGLSRSTGIVTGPKPDDRDEAPSTNEAPGAAGGGDALDVYASGSFDPGQIFSQFNPKILGAIELASVIPALKGFQDSIGKVPRLIKEKVQPVLGLVDEVRRRAAEFEQAVSAVARLPDEAVKALGELTQSLLGLLEPAEEGSQALPFLHLAKALNKSFRDGEEKLDALLAGLTASLDEGARAHARAADVDIVRERFARAMVILRQQLPRVLRVGEGPATTLDPALRAIVAGLPSLQAPNAALPLDVLAGGLGAVTAGIGRGVTDLVGSLFELDPAELLGPLRGLLREPADLLALPRRLERVLSQLEERLQRGRASVESVVDAAKRSAEGLRSVVQGAAESLQGQALLDEQEALVAGWGKLAHTSLSDVLRLPGVWKSSADVFVQDALGRLDALTGAIDAMVVPALESGRAAVGRLATDLAGLAALVEQRIRGFEATGKLAQLEAGLRSARESALSAVQALRREVGALRERIPTSVDARYTWDVPLQDAEPIFIASTGGCAGGGARGKPATFQIDTVGRLSLDGGPSVEIEASIRNFSLRLIPSLEFLCIEFEHVVMRGGSGRKPDVQVRIQGVTFGEKLKWVKELAEKLNPRNGFFLTLDGRGILAGFRFAMPNITSGALNMIDLAFEVALRLPFESDRDLRLRTAVSSRAKPFMITVGVLGGGGHFAMEVSPKRLEAFELTMEYGATVALDIGLASGQVYVRAGIYYSRDGVSVKLFAYLRAGGSLRVLGLIHVTVEFYLALEYYEDSTGSRLEGVARVHVEISILFFSVSVTLEVRRRIAGSGSPRSGEGSLEGVAPSVAPALPAQPTARSVHDVAGPEDVRPARERVPWSQARRGWAAYREQFVRV